MGNLKLATKIALGFASVALIAVALASVALWNMRTVGAKARLIEVESVPAVAVAADLERAYQRTMFEMRGYNYTENDTFLALGRKRLDEVKAEIALAREHGARYESAKDVAETATAVAERLRQYEQLVNEGVACTQAIRTDRIHLDEAAKRYMDACQEYLTSQEKQLSTANNEVVAGATTRPAEAAALAKRLDDRYLRVKAVNKVVQIGNNLRVLAWKAQSERNPKLLEEALKGLDDVNRQLAELRSMTVQAANLKMVEQCAAAASDYSKAMASLHASWLKRDELGKQRTIIGNAALDLTSKSASDSMAETTAATQQASATIFHASRIMWVGLAIGVVVACVLSVLITRGITRPINRIIDSLTLGAQQTAATASQVTSASLSLSSTASQQAAVVEETASSVAEIRAQSASAATLTTGATEMMNENIRKSSLSLKAVVDMTQRMAQIETDSKAMGKIIKTIDGIAFQTNLLALNAAVEAARAGEAGRGFAVVAGEVRALASRSAEAARSTQELLEGTALRVKESSGAIHEINDNFEAIVETATLMGSRIEQITAASREIDTGIEQISAASGESAQAAQTVAASSEESSAAAEELSAQARELGQLALDLQMLVRGGNRTTMAEAEAPSESPRQQTPPAEKPPLKLAA